MRSNEFNELLEIDSARKPAGANDEWALQHRYYEDCSRSDTLQRIRELGVGIRGNTRPLEISLMRRLVDRLAVIYARSPTRWLTRSGVRLDESSVDHKAMRAVLRLARYDLAWRLADRMRALMRQVVVRYYPSDVDKSVVLRVFAPYLVARNPSPDAPDSLDRDKSFALKMSGDVWEYWRREGEQWFCSWVDAKGKELPDHPFKLTSGVSTYPRLPAQIIYDDYAGGRDWLPPRQSRSAWMGAFNALENDLWALVTHEAHTQKYIATNDPTGLPKHVGPDEILTTPADATLGVLQYSPKIRESQEVIVSAVRLMLFGEDLPISEFDDAKQVVTGAALKVQSRPLIDRRESQVLLAESDERSAWSRFRGVHNVHASIWGVAELATDTEIEIEIAPLEIPEDESKLLDTDAKALAMHARSVIDVIQRLHHCNRDQAIEIYSRIESDNQEFKVTPPELDSSPEIDGRSDAQTPSDLPVDVSTPTEQSQQVTSDNESLLTDQPRNV